MRDTSSIGRQHAEGLSSSEQLYSVGETQLKPPPPPRITMSDDMRLGAESFATNLDEVFKGFLFKPGAAPEGFQKPTDLSGASALDIANEFLFNGRFDIQRTGTDVTVLDTRGESGLSSVSAGLQGDTAAGSGPVSDAQATNINGLPIDPQTGLPTINQQIMPADLLSKPTLMAILSESVRAAEQRQVSGDERQSRGDTPISEVLQQEAVGTPRAPGTSGPRAPINGIPADDLRRIAELSTEMLIALFLKLNITDPNNSVETHNQLHEIATNLRQQAIDESQKRQANANKMMKEAQAYADKAQTFSTIVMVVMIVIMIALIVLTGGLGLAAAAPAVAATTAATASATAATASATAAATAAATATTASATAAASASATAAATAATTASATTAAAASSAAAASTAAATTAATASATTAATASSAATATTVSAGTVSASGLSVGAAGTTVSGVTTTTTGSVIASGSTLAPGTVLGSGTVIGQGAGAVTLASPMTVSAATSTGLSASTIVPAAGSQIAAGSTLAGGSTLAAGTTVSGASFMGVTSGTLSTLKLGAAFANLTLKVTEAKVNHEAATKSADAKLAGIDAKRHQYLAELMQRQIEEEAAIVRLIMESKNQTIEAVLGMIQQLVGTSNAILSAGLAN
ncbi:MAG: hypothetical protein R3C68_02245 [Myxococcota bacterium]